MTRTAVFLHGGTAGGWAWQPQIEAFGDRPTLAPDLPGYLSRADERWTSFDLAADRIAALIAEKADGPVDVIGLSLGAITALHLASRHPDLVASAFVTGTSVLPYPSAQRAGNRVALALWNRRFYWTGMARVLGLRGDDAESFVAMAPPVSRSSIRDQLREVHPGGVTRLESVTAPVLAVVGERESAYFHRSLSAIGAAIPHAELGVAPGMHHGWSGEDDALFNRILRVWLDEGRKSDELLPPTSASPSAAQLGEARPRRQ
ncbi:alpha/beta fold hydrolase [Microbacterium sp. JB110]|uniref:alpha/beta fold hydrolase n=1 Tax=Microbacterium sp. JB110 TaxID=2024477 RepID=UPI00097ED0B3|nr:alpha/beta fold hydrolase [Microbacterium sp. JB110]SJM46459.1 putative hydrolase [Frigoribacterium sp. JB110]